MATQQPRITRVFGAVNIGSFRVSAMIMGQAEGGEMIILSPTWRMTRLLAKQRSRQISPTVPASAAKRARLSLSGVSAIDPIMPTILASPTIG